MDILKEIKEKLQANTKVLSASGLASVLTHIEIAERYHLRAKQEMDEHLYTDVIYRTNHAFEGILKEAYIVLDGRDASRKSPHEIEAYLLKSEVLQGRVMDLMTNYRQSWRNPSTHDYQLFFSQQESFLAIVTVSAFVSILLDQIIQKLAFASKFDELENAAFLAREKIANFGDLPPIEKVYKTLTSFGAYFVQNFDEMSGKPRPTANAEMAAFLSRVAPEMKVVIEPEFKAGDHKARFDMMVEVDKTIVLIETRDPKPREYEDVYFDDNAAIVQLAENLRSVNLRDGIVFHYPGKSDDTVMAITASTAWPKDLNMRDVYGEDPARYAVEDVDEPVDLIKDH